MKEMNSFVFYDTWWEACQGIDDAEMRWRFLEAVMRYAFEGVTCSDGRVLLPFLMVKKQIDADRAKYAESRRKRSEAGEKAVKTRWGRKAESDYDAFVRERISSYENDGGVSKSKGDVRDGTVVYGGLRDDSPDSDGVRKDTNVYERTTSDTDVYERIRTYDDDTKDTKGCDDVRRIPNNVYVNTHPLVGCETHTHEGAGAREGESECGQLGGEQQPSTAAGSAGAASSAGHDGESVEAFLQRQEERLRGEAWKSQSWHESLCMRHKMTEQELEVQWERFRLHCAASDKRHAGLKDIRDHFNCWLNSSREERNKQKEVDNDNEKNSRRRPAGVAIKGSASQKRSF